MSYPPPSAGFAICDKGKSIVRLYTSTLVTFIAYFFSFAPAFGAPTSYTFSTGTILPFGVPALISGLGNGVSVSGVFTYDSVAPATDTMLNYGLGTATIYGGQSSPSRSFYDIAGTVGAYSFSDPRGFVVVGDNMSDYPGRPPGQDWLGLTMEPGPRLAAVGPYNIWNLSRFAIGDYTLVNIRLFWFSGINGLTDFLSDSTMPGELPSLQGRLALDFALTADLPSLPNPSFVTNSVFFDGLYIQATPVPEPETYAILLAGLGLLGIAAWRRRLREAALA